MARRYVRRVPITTRLDGSALEIAVQVIEGYAPGPTLTVVSTLHGSEWFSIDVVRQFVMSINPDKLRGQVLAVPVANPIALEHLSRMTPDASDEPDLNRVWPGGSTWITEQIAARLAVEVVQGSSVVVDLHTGPWGSALGAVNYGSDFDDGQVARKSLELAIAYGYPSVRGLKVMHSFPGPRSLMGYAGAEFGIPSIGPNLGGAGFSPAVEESWVSANVTGLLNVARYLDMLDGDWQSLPDRMFHSESRGHRVVPQHGGLLIPHVGPDALLSEVSVGQHLADVVSPYTFEVLERITAPEAGVLFGICRTQPVRPGDWAFFLAGTDAGGQWVETTGGVDGTASRILDAGREAPRGT